MIAQCKDCKIRKPYSPAHEYQDKLYGKDMRVFNKTKDGFRCAVCGNEIKSGGLNV